MKIAQIAPPWISVPPKHYGGTETVIAHLIEGLVDLKHSVTLLAPGDAKTSAELVSFFPHSLREDGVPWGAHLKAYYHLQKSIEYIKRHHFDIVHLHLSSAADMYAFPLATSLATPVVVTLHSRFPFDQAQLCHGDMWTGDADNYYMEWLSALPMVAISQSAQAEVSYPLHFVGVVPHGLPMDVFQPTVDQSENFLVWLGRFAPVKGAHLAIEAAQAVKMPLVLAGIVDEHIAEQVAYFEEKIKPHLDGQQIRYIGPVNMEQKRDLLSRAKGFLNPIEWEEPFGMVMIEAMSVGCPVISFTRGAATEVVADGIGGFLVQDVQEMIQSVARLDELDRQKVRAYAKSKFSLQTMARNYLKVYQKVIASKQLETAMPRLSLTTSAPLPGVLSDPLQRPTSLASLLQSPTEVVTNEASTSIQRMQ